MEILTSYFNRAKYITHDRFIFVAITRGKVPIWFPHTYSSFDELRPSWNLVSCYKNGTISWDEYEKEYIAEIRLNETIDDIRNRLIMLSEDNGGRDPVLLCHCMGNCHRHILRKALNGRELTIADLI